VPSAEEADQPGKHRERVLNQSSGPTEANADGQRLFLEGMIKHHAGAIEMAQKEITGGQHPGAVDLAMRIAENQQQEIQVMTNLLTRI
jgi:uncharacterized protein (DUF305 family)